MKSLELRDKDRVVLNLIAEDYLHQGRPVSSEAITQKRTLRVSPATIRNIMARLEGQGYLFKPHTSAGRVPTDKGLRHYVNSLLDEVRSSGGEPGGFGGEIFQAEGDFQSLLGRVTQLLADQSDNLGFVLSPRMPKIGFNHLRLIRVAEDKVMIILLTTFNLVLHDILKTSQYFTQQELDEASLLLNTRFRGKTLLFVRDYLSRDLPGYQRRQDPVLEKLLGLLKSYLQQEDQVDQILVQGAPRLLARADEFSLEKLKLLFRNIEDKSRLAKVISEFVSLDRVKVLIGTETDLPDIADCALVLSHYGPPTQVFGSLGIIGPKRIPYRRIIPLVDHIAQGLSQAVSKTS